MKTTRAIGRAIGGMILAVGLALLTVEPATANNIAVTNVVLVNQNPSATTVDVQFDLSWQNAWRNNDPAYPAYTNWDAAWVFVKFVAPGSNIWQHAILSATGTDHTPAANSTITPTSDGVGAFVYRSAGYTGDVSYAGMRLRWNYGANGYSFSRGASLTVSVQAVEMVYVPQGPFWAGNTNSDENGSFRSPSSASTPFYIADPNAFTIYWGTGSGTATSVPSAFPNGYSAFYCMKYDISQGQYCDFLNMLIRTQQNVRTANRTANYFTMSASTTVSYRNGIRCPSVIPGGTTNIVFGCDANVNGVFNEPADGMDRGCNYLSWSDGAAYAAWAGLRPMTELEFEKACRGPVAPVNGEYAWGSTAATGLSAENNDGYGTSTPNPATANCSLGESFGPVRAGLYATASSTRAQAGASYWGIMELSGNMAKRCMSVGLSNGLAFTGSHGSGVLDASGRATNADWWTDASGADASGVINRGGQNNNSQPSRVSDRGNASQGCGGRGWGVGGRAVRTAP